MKRKTGKLTGARGEDRGKEKVLPGRTGEPIGRRTRSDDIERTSFESQR